MPGFVALDERGVPLLVGLEKHDLAGHKHRQTQPEKPAFQIHGWLLFAVSKAAVKHEMTRRVEKFQCVFADNVPVFACPTPKPQRQRRIDLNASAA
jgi:hypothetical protein